jgi:hypothetical protein
MKEKVIVITDAHGKLLGAHRNVPIKHGNGTVTFRAIDNPKQKAHEIEVDEHFFERSPEQCRSELTKLLASRQ